MLIVSLLIVFFLPNYICTELSPVPDKSISRSLLRVLNSINLCLNTNFVFPFSCQSYGSCLSGLDILEQPYREKLRKLENLESLKSLENMDELEHFKRLESPRHSTVEGFIEKRRQRSSLLLGGQNCLYSLTR